MVCLGNGQVTRLDAYNMLVEVDDLSEDETSPAHALSDDGCFSAIRGAQRAFDFGSDLMSLNVRASMISGSLHVDVVARQLAESFNALENESSGELKDPQERFERYVHSYMSEVSGPECWMDVRHETNDMDGEMKSEAGWKVSKLPVAISHSLG